MDWYWHCFNCVTAAFVVVLASLPHKVSLVDRQHTLNIVDKQGRHGTGSVSLTPVNGADQKWILVQFTEGREVWVPAQTLSKCQDGTYFLNLDTGHQQAQIPTEKAQENHIPQETTVVPVLAEKVDIAKRKVVSGKVQVRKVIHERQEIMDEFLHQETVNVERVSVDRFVDGPLENRYEGDTLIMPVVEEVLVVEKRFLLKEEVHIHKHHHVFHHQQQISVQREEALIERIEKPEED
jgi:uncharacterized protein (TIGR02271 family)